MNEPYELTFDSMQSVSQSRDVWDIYVITPIQRIWKGNLTVAEDGHLDLHLSTNWDGKELSPALVRHSFSTFAIKQMVYMNKRIDQIEEILK